MTNAANEPNPGFIFDTLNAYQRSAALRGAIDLDVFSKIAEGKRTATELAQACGTPERATRILCDYLVVIGFLTKQDNRYDLTPTAAAFLVKQSPAYMGNIARFINSTHLLESFRDVAELVRRGRTLLDGAGTVEDQYAGWVEFAKSMAPLMAPAAEFIGELTATRVPAASKVLDVAAGHGLFGIAVARRIPSATVVALDWPNVLSVAQANAAQAGIASRYTLLPGDALKIDFGTGYDLVLLTNFLHHFDVATCEALMQKVACGLKADGVVITLEFVPNADRVSPPEAAAFAFTMLGTTPSGDAYTLAEYQAMWHKAGLTKHEMLNVPKSVQQVIVSRR